jgi:hypothetical protein
VNDFQRPAFRARLGERKVEGAGDTRGHVDGEVEGQFQALFPGFSKEGPEVETVHVLQGHEEIPIDLAQFVNRDNVGMVEECDRLCLFDEQMAKIRVAGQAREDLLENDGFSERSLPCLRARAFPRAGTFRRSWGRAAGASPW